MFAFLRKNQILLSSCFCLLLSLYILTAAARGQLRNDPIGPILLWIMRPLQIVAQATTNWIDAIQNSYLMVAGYKSENEKLRNRIQQLEVERNQLLEAEATNRRLQELLEFRSHLQSGTVTASIIANSGSSWFKSCLLRQRKCGWRAQGDGGGYALGRSRASCGGDGAHGEGIVAG